MVLMRVSCSPVTWPFALLLLGRVVDSKVAGSCKAYGCTGYRHSQSCQCNAQCGRHHNCCSDYAATCTGAAGKVHGHPSASKTYPSYPGFSLALVEEFDEPLDLDSDPIWTWSDGGLAEGQVRYGREGIKFGGGKMRLEVSRKAHAAGCSKAEGALVREKNLTSGELRTRHNMFRYGRYEAHIKAPSVQPGDAEIKGNYVSTMFLFRDGKYKHWREIDVEITGGGGLTSNLLSADNTAKWRPDIAETKEHNVNSNLRAAFHTYAIEWLPDSVRWFFDGKVVRETKGGGVPIPNLSTKIMMSLWVFEDRAHLFGGEQIGNNRYPMQAEYDWFRFYRWDEEDHYPCAGMGTECLAPDDRYLSSNNPCDGIRQEGTVNGETPCEATCR